MMSFVLLLATSVAQAIRLSFVFLKILFMFTLQICMSGVKFRMFKSFLSVLVSCQLKGKKGTNGVASKQKMDQKNQAKKNGMNGMNGTASLKRNTSSK